MTTQLNFFDLPTPKTKEKKPKIENLFPKPVIDYARQKGYKVEFHNDRWSSNCIIHLNNGFLMKLDKYFEYSDPHVNLSSKDDDCLCFDYGYDDRITNEQALEFLKILETKKLGEPLYILREPPKEVKQ